MHCRRTALWIGYHSYWWYTQPIHNKCMIWLMIHIYMFAPITDLRWYLNKMDRCSLVSQNLSDSCPKRDLNNYAKKVIYTNISWFGVSCYRHGEWSRGCSLMRCSQLYTTSRYLSHAQCLIAQYVEKSNTWCARLLQDIEASPQQPTNLMYVAGVVSYVCSLLPQNDFQLLD